MKDISVIPQGSYCYSGAMRTNPCPYWSIKPELHKYENGYCSYLEQSDVDLKGGLLWDQCKECGIKEEDDET